MNLTCCILDTQVKISAADQKTRYKLYFHKVNPLHVLLCMHCGIVLTSVLVVHSEGVKKVGPRPLLVLAAVGDHEDIVGLLLNKGEKAVNIQCKHNVVFAVL